MSEPRPLAFYVVPEVVSADFGVGHDWTNVYCPAYSSRDGNDCTCDNLACRNTSKHLDDWRWMRDTTSEPI